MWPILWWLELQWDNHYDVNYRNFIKAKFNAEPDLANYDIHHVLPQKYRDLLSQASNGRIDVDSPGPLREGMRVGPITGERTHQSLYTDTWKTWESGLGHQPSAIEVVKFAQQLGDQYAVDGTLFYRNGLLERIVSGSLIVRGLSTDVKSLTHSGAKLCLSPLIPSPGCPVHRQRAAPIAQSRQPSTAASPVQGYTPGRGSGGAAGRSRTR